jgi:ADP-heptose:LPS heptosyltransferase
VARLGALVSALDLLVGIDSGPKHLAVVEGVPTVTLFGPTDPRVWDPMTERHRALHLGTDCFPCRKKECAPNRCLDDITPDMVMAEVARALPANGGRARRLGRPGK